MSTNQNLLEAVQLCLNSYKLGQSMQNDDATHDAALPMAWCDNAAADVTQETEYTR